MSFVYNEDYIFEKIFSVDSYAVRDSLKKEKHNFADFLTFISPAAENFLEEMAYKGMCIKKKRFGKTIKLYAPLYISNKCFSSCLYCGFNSSTSINRKTLSFSEIRDEAEKIKESGFDNLLIVSGFAPDEVTIDFLLKTVEILKVFFSYLAVEIFPLDENQYQYLVDAGVDGLVLYQETYNRQNYEKMHPSGKKRDYDFRLNSLSRGGKAGFKDLGLGVLLGLYDWRIDSALMYQHAYKLKNEFWKSRINFSFPRLRPAGKTGFMPPFEVTDKNLTQMMLAFRICFPDSGLSLSTRESASLRNNLIPLGITQVSAGSKTMPGGYAAQNDSGAQFDIADERTPQEIVRIIRSKGMESVFKDWDSSLK